MTAPRVRADYDSLKQVAASFSGQAQAARQTLQSLQSQMDTLQGGDWIGQGAEAFYQEMGDQVLPTLKRLASALETAQQSTLQISQIIQQAEANAAQVLRGPGGAGGAAGPSGAAGGAAAGPGGGAGSSASVAETLGGVLGAIAGSALGPAGAIAGGLAGAAAGAAVTRAQQDAAVDQMLTKFDPQVVAMVKQSPTLRAEVLKLQQAGYSVNTGSLADGYFTDRTNKTIVIDQPLDPATTVSHIAHEVGHGVSSQQESIPATPTMTRDQYVQQNVDNYMHNEGEAQFNAAQVRAELTAAGQPDPGIPGTQTDAYQKVYADFSAGKITQDQAISQMGTLMGNEHVSTPPYQAYRDAYGDAFKQDWDTNIAPTRHP
jgi:WXG100 family type VII secretion target